MALSIVTATGQRPTEMHHMSRSGASLPCSALQGSAATPPVTAASVALAGALHFFLHAGQADVFHVGAAYQVDHQLGDIARVVADALQRTQGPDDVEHARD